MKRYWLPTDSIEGNQILIEGDYFHHINVVCRNGLGSKFEILTGKETAYFVELIEINKKSGMAKILEKREIAPLPRPYIHLVLSIPRFHKMDEIIEKSVELGVFRIIPVVSDYSFIRKIDGSLRKKEKRWQKIVQSATQQSGRGQLMEITEPTTLDQALVQLSEDINQRSGVKGLFPYEGEAEQGLKQALQSVKGAAPEGNGKFSDIWVFVGSEGGFSLNEVENFSKKGLKSITMGKQILRVDTACLALISILKYEFDLMGEKNDN